MMKPRTNQTLQDARYFKMANDVDSLKRDTELKLEGKFSQVEGVLTEVKEVKKEVQELADTTKTVLNQLDTRFEEHANEVVEIIKDIKENGLKGEKGDGADEEAIEKRLLNKIPTLEKIVEKLPSKEDIVEEVIKQIPENKPSLKIIQESIDIEEVASKVEEKLNEKPFEIDKVNGLKGKLDNITRDLARKTGYHGGGDTVKAGSNITITTDSAGAKVISATGTGTGSVTDFTFNDTNGFVGNVTNSTTTPELTLETDVTGIIKGSGGALTAAVANTDFQIPLVLTTIGSSGAATFDGETLNIPQYLGGGGGTPGGSDTQLQYNNAGAFGGISGATTDGTATTFTTGNLKAADVKASSSAGLQILSNTGTVTSLHGAGGGANNTFYGDVKLDYTTATTVPYIDASKNLISSAVTPTELDYVSGVTSSIQTQIGTKVTGPASATDNAVVRFDNTTGKLVQDSAVTIADTSGDITGGKYNKVTITAPATGSTLTIADGQTLTVNGSATITNGTHSGTNTGDQTASTLAIAKLSTPAVDTVQEYLDSTGSSGYFSGGEITNGAAGTVNIAAGAGFIRATNSTTAQLLSFEWSAFSNVAIASDTTKYIYISYNGGSPTYVLSATATDEDPTKILVGIATNEGGTIVATLNAGVRLDESIGEAGRYLRRVFGFVRDSSVGGLIVSGTGTRNIALSAGTLWYGRTMYNISAIDTSGAGTFATYYRNGSGGFTKTSSVTQWNNTQYDNGTGTLATLAANKWAVAWLYVSADGLFYYVYGRASHTSQAAAETEALPATLPNVITAGTLLVGRLIFQKSASTATFYSAFTNTFSNTGVTLHNDLGSIQGGTSGEYYHLTSAEYTGTGTGNFVRDTSPTLTTPVIGTPSSGTLTNCTGLPVAGITASTSTALGVGSIELGNASDTTISRSAAGVLAVEGVVIPSISSTNTLTNKRITRRLSTTNAPGATPTTNTDNVDIMNFTGLNAAITSMTTNLSGTPSDGDKVEFRFTDDGTARAITWGTSFAATTVALPTTTVISTMLRAGFEWNATASKWQCIAVA